MEILEQKRNAAIEKQQVEEKLARLEQMEAELKDANQKIQRIEPMAKCIQEMVDAGALKTEVDAP